MTCENQRGSASALSERTGSAPRRVVCAAYMMDDGLIVTGARHFSPDMRATMKRIYGDKYHLRRNREHHEGGFIDQFGEYLTREEAWKIAEANGQIWREVAPKGTLYSENLY